MRCEKGTLPTAAGTYILLLHLRSDKRIEVGRLGRRLFKEGWYAYVGSAFGPGGLAARIGRHIRRDKKQHWHIDYLSKCASIKEAWISTATHPREHEWADRLQNASWVIGSVEAFGSSDCRCPSHLFHFKKHPGPAKLKRAMGADIIAIKTD